VKKRNILRRYESGDIGSAEGSPARGSPRIFLQDEDASDSSIEEYAPPHPHRSNPYACSIAHSHRRVRRCGDCDLDPTMNIDAVCSGGASSGGVSPSRLSFAVMVSGAAAVPSAFGGKAHTCYSLDVALSFSRGQGGGSSWECAASRGCLDLQCDAPFPRCIFVTLCFPLCVFVTF
jgi:hypothetical protein